MSARQAPDRNIALELVRVTEAAAMAAARWIGRGDKEDADQAAVDAMRFVLDSVAMRGVGVFPASAFSAAAACGPDTRTIAIALGERPDERAKMVWSRRCMAY